MAKRQSNMGNLLKNQKLNLVIAAIAAVVVVVAGYFVISTAAAGFFAALESEQGATTGNASVIDDSLASGGKAIQFNAPATPPPTGACESGTHVPGSADPWGGCWPGPKNTGVPAGTVLSDYTGPCTLTTPGTVIDKKTINCDIVVKTSGVIIKNSVVNGHVDVDGSSYSATIQDSTVNGGGNTGIGYGNITVIRANISGAQHNVLCGSNCIVRDSWLHGQLVKGDSHNNAILSNGGSNIQSIHNTLYCEPRDNDQGGGCTGDLSLFGDNDPITNVVVDKNLFLATPGGYCFAGGYQDNKPFGLQARKIDVTNNIFKRGSGGKCAFWGPVTNYTTAGGGIWSNNKWEDGAVVTP